MTGNFPKLGFKKAMIIGSILFAVGFILFMYGVVERPTLLKAELEEWNESEFEMAMESNMKYNYLMTFGTMLIGLGMVILIISTIISIIIYANRKKRVD
jgi:ABC-type antimicrobial peptide transport system permease subunit